MKKRFTVASMFAGIGGIDLGFEQAGCKVVWANEIDKYACRTYRLNFGDEYLVEGDIQEVSTDTIPDFDILIAGFPCQAFSSVGLLKGFEDPRGNLFFETARVIAAKKPPVSLYFIETISDIFAVNVEEIEQLGEDNIEELISTHDPDIFKKEAIADLKIESKKIHIEVQSGFTGVNDIKKSKADDAKRRYSENGWKTVIVHFDLFRGLVAAVDITKLSDELPEKQWKNNKQFENVKTTPIKDACFVWRITEETELNDIMTTIQ